MFCRRGNLRQLSPIFAPKRGGRQTTKNPTGSGNPAGNLWLAVIDELRTKSSEIILSLTEELKIVYEHMVDIYKTRTKK